MEMQKQLNNSTLTVALIGRLDAFMNKNGGEMKIKNVSERYGD